MKFAADKNIDVVGVGNAMMDLLVLVDDEFLTGLGLEKGNTYFVDAVTALARLEPFEADKIITIPGGAAANAIKTAAVLGGNVALFAAVGDDIYGKRYIRAMQSHGVATYIKQYGDVTGHALTYITPDAERTFSDHLGAILRLQPEDLDEEVLAASKILHLEAYQLEGDTRAVVERAIAIAKANGVKISLDLTDPRLVERHLDTCKNLVENHIDILFANEAEAKAFIGLGEEAAVAEMMKLVEIAVVKIGDQGSLVGSAGKIISVPAVPTTPVDTTGAGDVYAGAFLYGLTQGWNIEDCGTCGAKLAAEIIAHIGVPVEKLTTS